MEGNVATLLHFYETQHFLFSVLRIMKDIALFRWSDLWDWRGGIFTFQTPHWRNCFWIYIINVNAFDIQTSCKRWSMFPSSFTSIFLKYVVWHVTDQWLSLTGILYHQVECGAKRGSNPRINAYFIRMSKEVRPASLLSRNIWVTP